MSWGHPAYSFLETESGVCEHRFQVAGTDGFAWRQSREILQNPAQALTLNIPVILPVAKNRPADGYSHSRHVALQISCKTLSVKRNPLKTQNGG
jgi:hypothetical protein